MTAPRNTLNPIAQAAHHSRWLAARLTARPGLREALEVGLEQPFSATEMTSVLEANLATHGD